MKHTARVRLPECWKSLIKTEFPDDLKGVLGEKTDHSGIADPKPHYDDCRTVEGRFDSGVPFCLSLASGQSNYYGDLSIGDALTRGLDSIILESLYSPIEVVEGDHTYIIDIDWVPDAEWNLNLSVGRA